MLSRFFKFLIRHKLAGVIFIMLLVIGGYYTFKLFKGDTAEIRYVLATVTKGTLVNSISGSGQISVTNQVDVKAKTGGEVLSALVKDGQEVKSGAVLAQLNARDAYKAVRDAQANLESAQLTLDKLKQPPDQLSVLQIENALSQAQETKQNAQNNIAKGYEDAFNKVADTFLDLPTIITKLHDVLYSNDIGTSEKSVGKYYLNTDALINTTNPTDREKLQTFQASAQNDYLPARTKFDTNFEHYKNATRYSNQKVIDSLLQETLETTRAMAQAAKSESNYFDSWVDLRTAQGWTTFAKVTEYQTNLATYIGQTSSHLSDLLAIQQSLQDNREAVVNADRTIAEKIASLNKLKAGTDQLDIQSQVLAIKQRQNALLDAKEKLADYTVRAPFDGVLAVVSIKKGDTASSGSVIATLVTKQQTAEISLNEVDITKVKVGQKVTLTFDAVDGLSLTGGVGAIDALGTVSQGVVNYNVKIVFDTQDERIKSGMSVSASIITNVKTNVLMVLNSAIKSDNQGSYVEMPNEQIINNSSTNSNQGVVLKNVPHQQTIQTGLASDSFTEIISGLNEGDQIIVRTIDPTKTTTAATTRNTGIRIPGVGGSGGFRPD